MSTLTSPSGDPRAPLNLRNGSAIFLVALASLMLANLAPLVMTALGSIGYDTLASGNILTLALLASSIVGLGTTTLAAGRARRLLAAIGLTLATLAFTSAMLVAIPTIVATALVVGGAGVGAAISTSGAAIAALLNPNRVSALSSLVNRVLITIILAVIPLVGVGRVSVFGALALTSLIALLFSVRLPESLDYSVEIAADSPPANAHNRHATIAGVTLLILLPLWGASEDAIWAMTTTLGGAIGVSEDLISLTLSLATAVGIVGVLLMIIFGNRLGRALPLALALFLGGALKMWLGAADSPPLFVALIVGINAVYAFALILFIATSAALDVSGRWSGPIGGAYLLGSSLAPLIGSALIEWFGIPTFTILMGLISFVAVIPSVLIARVATRRELSLAAAPTATERG